MISERERKHIIEALKKAIPYAEKGFINVSAEAAEEIVEMLEGHEKEVQHLNDLIRYRDSIIEDYHRADGFLAAHGWRWETNETADP
jgi:hypothetical protein